MTRRVLKPLGKEIFVSPEDDSKKSGSQGTISVVTHLSADRLTELIDLYKALALPSSRSVGIVDDTVTLCAAILIEEGVGLD